MSIVYKSYPAYVPTLGGKGYERNRIIRFIER